MDRSFLSDAAVIEAARKFVCVRIATYEDEKEAEFVKTKLMGGSGDLRNFGFALASPDFGEIIVRSRQGPNFLYEDADAMAANLNEIAADFPTKPSAKKSAPPVPEMKDVRLALNVASCDGLPCLVIAGRDEATLSKMKARLSEVIWDEQIAGRFICGSAIKKEDLSMIEGITQVGFLIVRPDAFGLEGEAIAILSENMSTEALRSELLAVAGDYSRISKTHGSHVREGRQTSVQWESEVEVPTRRRTQR